DCARLELCARLAQGRRRDVGQSRHHASRSAVAGTRGAAHGANDDLGDRGGRAREHPAAVPAGGGIGSCRRTAAERWSPRARRRRSEIRSAGLAACSTSILPQEHRFRCRSLNSRRLSPAEGSKAIDISAAPARTRSNLMHAKSRLSRWKCSRRLRAVILRLPARRWSLRPADHRRNLTTRGVPLSHLVGKRFKVGEAVLVGGRLNFPCRYLEKLLGRPVWTTLLNRPGLNCRIEVGGIVRKGDPISPL